MNQISRNKNKNLYNMQSTSLKQVGPTLFPYIHFQYIGNTYFVFTMYFHVSIISQSYSPSLECLSFILLW